MTAALAARSSGLEGMRERSRLAGGRLVIESEPGKGARLSVELPLDRSLRNDVRAGAATSPRTSVASVSPARSQESLTARAGSTSGAGWKNSAQAKAMNSQQTTATTTAAP